MKIITEDFWLDNLMDRDGVSLRIALQTSDNPDKVKREVFEHASELLHMYCVPGRQRPLWPEAWNGKFGLFYQAKLRAAWLAAPKSMQDACHEAHNNANDCSWKARHNARDWREKKEYEQQSKTWRNWAYELCGEIYGTHYEHPACLI